MNIIDISWPLDQKITGYKNKKSLEINELKKYENDKVRESSITISAHAGTHIDAPSHFLETGNSIEKTTLNSLIGKAQVVDVTHCLEKIVAQDLETFQLAPHSIILLKTQNSSLSPQAPFNPNFVYLDESAADYLVKKEIKAVGIDYLGIERNQSEHPTHKKLLTASITIIEGLRLNHVKAGLYFLVCLPLALHTIEAAPARALLFSDLNL